MTSPHARTSVRHRSLRLAVLLALLAMSLVAFGARDAIRMRLAPDPGSTQRMVGTPAPELPRMHAIDDRTVTLASLRGRVVMLEFWTFACDNCEHALADVRDFHARYESRGLSVVGIHTPETPHEADANRVTAFVHANRIPWPVLLDPDFTAWERFGVMAWPTFVLLDRRGNVRGSFVGEGRRGAIEQQLVTLLAEH